MSATTLPRIPRSELACVAQVVAHRQPMLTASAEVVHVLLPPSPRGLTREHLDFAHVAEVVARIFAADISGPDERTARFPACSVVPFHPLGRQAGKGSAPEAGAEPG